MNLVDQLTPRDAEAGTSSIVTRASVSTIAIIQKRCPQRWIEMGTILILYFEPEMA
jgi:hypothetical protein